MKGKPTTCISVLLSVTGVDCRPVRCMSIRSYSEIDTQFMSPERTSVCAVVLCGISEFSPDCEMCSWS